MPGLFGFHWLFSHFFFLLGINPSSLVSYSLVISRFTSLYKNHQESEYLLYIGQEVTILCCISNCIQTKHRERREELLVHLEEELEQVQVYVRRGTSNRTHKSGFQ